MIVKMVSTGAGSHHSAPIANTHPSRNRVTQRVQDLVLAQVEGEGVRFCRRAQLRVKQRLQLLGRHAPRHVQRGTAGSVLLSMV
jgi:hypothetical protein